MIPCPSDLRRAGELVDGTGYASAAFVGVFLGALGGYIVRSVLDHSIWRAKENDDRDQPA
jgi:hypothetical protein